MKSLPPRVDEIPELGWAFLLQVHGQGYATESVRAAIGWADAVFRLSGPAASSTLVIFRPSALLKSAAIDWQPQSPTKRNYCNAWNIDG